MENREILNYSEDEEVFGADEEQEEPEEEESLEEEPSEEDVPEEEPEADPNDDDGEVEPEPEAPKLKKREPTKERINQIQREKFKALNEAKLLREEVERLRGQQEQAQQAAMYQYDNSLAMRLTNAKQDKIRAIEAGDVEAQVTADQALAELVAEKVNVDSWKAQESMRKNNAQQAVAEPDAGFSEEQEAHASDWLQDNPWFNKQSKHFNEPLHQAAIDYAKQIDDMLNNNGNSHMIFTPEYFNEIDGHVQKLVQQQQPRQSRSLNMSAPRHPVAPMRNAGQRAAATKQSITLSADDKAFARQFGMPEAEYAKYVKAERNKPFKGQ